MHAIIMKCNIIIMYNYNNYYYMRSYGRLYYTMSHETIIYIYIIYIRPMRRCSADDESQKILVHVRAFIGRRKK